MKIAFCKYANDIKGCIVLIKSSSMPNARKAKTKSFRSRQKESKVRVDNSTKLTCCRHVFSLDEKRFFRTELLKWFDKNQRKLPWRDAARDEEDLDKRGYAVWVSEIMLQQTQVATVIPYYTKWMKKWPTVSDLSAASLEEVNKVWAGLGYYSRAKRLHEGAVLLTKERDGHIPQMAKDLKETLPGIGRYTASAISSIAYQSVTGVVDGNVSRVLSRVRAIGCDITKPFAQTHLWELADDIVSEVRPGDFNQALMELGAMICTPRNPSCRECPLNHLCLVYCMSENTNQKIDVMTKPDKEIRKESELLDIESCHMCIAEGTWKLNPNVSTFPCKPKKKESRLETVAVIVVERDQHLLTIQRPNKGLLAGLWEFPSVLLPDEIPAEENSKRITDYLQTFGISPKVSKKSCRVGEVLHIFSHIRTTYIVDHLIISDSTESKSNNKTVKWIKREDVEDSAMSTAMKKVLHAVDDFNGKSKKMVPSKKRKLSPEMGKQRSIKSFFS